MAIQEAFLETKNLTKQFGGLIAVNRVNYTLREGEVVGIIGPNGAGKSTFFNLLTGLFPPTEGHIYFEGKEITKIPPHQRVNMGLVRTFQLVSVFGSLTVFDNVVLANVRFGKNYTSKWRFFLAKNHPVSTVRNCRKILKQVGLEDKADFMTSELSYGDKRKLEIAIALSLNPKFLLLDEPLAGLSEREIDEILNLLNNIKKRLTLVIIEHKVSRIVNLVEKLSVMHKGEFIAEGKPADILKNPLVRQVYWHEGGT